MTKIRIELLRFLLKLNTSIGTILRIAQMMENKTDEQGEELASQILDKIIDCKNEAEVLVRLFME